MEVVLESIRALPLPEVDIVVGIERGGLVPATIAASILEVPLGRIRLNYRDDHHNIQFDEPRLEGSAIPDGPHRRVLVVDDVSVSGATLNAARKQLDDSEVTTLTLTGEADLVAFPAIDGCVIWPWSTNGSLQR